MRFLLDEDVHPGVAPAARALGLDVVSVHEVDRRGFSDRDQLEFAISRERVLVTRNRDDFILLTEDAFHSASAHWGVLIVPYSLPNHDPGGIARALETWHRRAGSVEPVPYLIDFLKG